MGDPVAVRCLHCGTEYPAGLMGDGCPSCREPGFVSTVNPVYDISALKKQVTLDLFEKRAGPGIWRFRELLPVPEPFEVSLGEGNTPLLPCPTISKRMGLPGLLVKDESRNPTLSFKDRQSAVAVSWARMAGAPGIALSSSGNQGSSYAAYAARAGIPCVIFTFPESSEVQRHQMIALGGKLIATSIWTDREKLVGICVSRYGWHGGSNYSQPTTGTHPIGLEGYKTLAYEIVLQLGGRVPDWVIFPCGYGDSLYGCWRGFNDLHALGLIGSRPRMVAAEINGPVAHAIRNGLSIPVAVPARPTVALSSGTTTAPYHALRAVRDSGGIAATVTEEEIQEIQRELATQEGIYAEPSSVTSVALCKKLRAAGEIRENDSVVCILTASGLKDPKSMGKSSPQVPVIPADADALERAIEEAYHFTIR